MTRSSWFVALLLAVACQGAQAQPAAPPDIDAAVRAAHSHAIAHDAQIVQELRDLLSVPNMAGNPGDMRRNADLLIAMFARRGISARILETPGAAPAVYAELTSPGATRTLLFYAHVDGQPVGPLDAWATPPFTPTLRLGRLEDGVAVTPWSDARYPLDDNARIYARSAADDKAPIVAMLAAIDALRAEHVPLSANLKFFLEGEEEAGSPHLAQVLAAHRDVLGADLWLFGDGPIDPRGLPRIALGARGIASFELTVFGPAYGLHSGHYGNVAANPGARLARLIASMRADDGRITIAGFEAWRPPAEALALAREAFDTPSFLRGPQLAATESGLSYGESILRPALNVTQLSYGGAGPARNAIDPEAHAAFDIRLTPGLSVAQARVAIEAQVSRQGYVLVNSAPSEAQRLANPRLARVAWNDIGYNAAMSPLSDPGVRRVIEVMRAATNNEVRVAPLLGGSLPIAPIGDVLHAPFVIAPIVNADDNQHAPNENVRMREFRRGIEQYAVLLASAGRW